jgi:hypothetical protein
LEPFERARRPQRRVGSFACSVSFGTSLATISSGCRFRNRSVSGPFSYEKGVGAIFRSHPFESRFQNRLHLSRFQNPGARVSAPAAGSNFLRFRTISAPFHPRGRCGWGQPRSGSGGLKEPHLPSCSGSLAADAERAGQLRPESFSWRSRLPCTRNEGSFSARVRVTSGRRRCRTIDVSLETGTPVEPAPETSSPATAVNRVPPDPPGLEAIFEEQRGAFPPWNVGCIQSHCRPARVFPVVLPDTNERPQETEDAPCRQDQGPRAL